MAESPITLLRLLCVDRGCRQAPIRSVASSLRSRLIARRLCRLLQVVTTDSARDQAEQPPERALGQV